MKTRTNRSIVDFIRDLYDEPTSYIPLHAPVFLGNEKSYLIECIDTTFVSSVGKFVDRFEEMVANYTGSKYAVSVVNGTNALHLALHALCVNDETEVITQALTFIATTNAISYTGAKPVFIDVDIDTMGMSPKALKEWLISNVNFNSRKQPVNKNSQRRISAILPMNTFGHPCRLDEIKEIADEFNIPLVEDAAESMGSLFKDKHTGTFGKIGVFSFNGNKTITTGGGGMLVTDDEYLAKELKHLVTQAKVPHPWEYTHDRIGYNYRLPNINAALGVAQMEKIEEYIKSKRRIAKYYEEFFESSSVIKDGSKILCNDEDIFFFKEPSNAMSNYWLNAILFYSKQRRDEFLEYSNSKGIMTRPIWRLMNKLQMYANCQTDALVHSNWLEERIINLPSSYIEFER